MSAFTACRRTHLLALLILQAASLAASSPSPSPRRLIVGFRTDLASARSAHPSTVLGSSANAKSLHMDGVYRVDIPDDESMRDAVDTLNADPTVAFVEEDTLLHAYGRAARGLLNSNKNGDDTQHQRSSTPGGTIIGGATTPPGTIDDPLSSRQWSLNAIKIQQAWDEAAKGTDANVGRGAASASSLRGKSTASSSNNSERIKVCVIDTGVALDHPDLAANVGAGYNAIDDSSQDGGKDENGHGTHCAGVIGAARNNKLGIAGIDGDNVEILGCKFMTGTTGFLSDAVDCINWCREQNATITSNSWGGGGSSEAMAAAISKSCDAGHTFVAAAGNTGENNDNVDSFPATYAYARNLSCVISVAAVDSNNTIASFSNYGAKSTHIAAPGVKIVSTYVDKKYAELSGTSMAAPHVSGVLALMAATNPKLDGPRLRELLFESADSVQGLTSYVQNGRVLNAYAAVKAAREAR